MPMVSPEQRGAGASHLPPGGSGGGVEGATGCANEVNEVEQSRTQASAAFENLLLIALNTPTENMIFENYLAEQIADKNLKANSKMSFRYVSSMTSADTGNLYNILKYNSKLRNLGW